MAMCRNPKLWIALGAVAILFAIASSSWGAVLPILFVAACPLMMLLMAGRMAGMARGRDDTSSAHDGELERLRADDGELRHSAER